VKKWYWVALAIIAYLAFLVAFTPAIYVTNFITEQSHKNNNASLSFTGVSGTLFDGQALSVISQGIQVNGVKWQLSPWSLLLLQANLDFTSGNIRNAEEIYAKGSVSTSLLKPQAFSLRQAQVFVPTKTLLSQLKLPVFVSAAGRFRIDIDYFEFDQGCEVLEGRGNWLNAAVNVNQQSVDFGTFDASLNCETPAFAMQISPQNRLSLDAKLVFDIAGKYNIGGSFSVPSDMPTDIKQAAPFFGRETSPGQYQISF